MRLEPLHIASLVLTSLLFASVYPAAAKSQEASVQIRVYDRDHKDYHNWDDRENSAWMQYQSENHVKQHDFKKANKKEQSSYWNWRHDHPDHDRDDRR